MRTQVLDDVVERDAQVFEQRHLGARFVIPWHGFVKDGEVASLFDIGHRTENEPHRVVVEATADIVVTPFGERLILMVASTVGELCRGDVDDALTCSAGNLMDESHQVLIGVAEAHTSSDAALEETGRTREVERYHTLVLVPNVHHAVELLVSTLHAVTVKQVIPVSIELLEGFIHLFGGIKLLDAGTSLGLVNEGAVELVKRSDQSWCLLFLVFLLLLVLYVT